MPTVGKESFSYDPVGVSKARREATKTGLPMKMQGEGQSNTGVPTEGAGNVPGQTLGNPGATQPENFAGGVAPINPGGNPNQGAVNNFMNQNAIGNLADGANMNPNTQDIAKLQNGLNHLNQKRPGYTPLKVDGVMGPKTRGTADMYLGRNPRT